MLFLSTYTLFIVHKYPRARVFVCVHFIPRPFAMQRHWNDNIYIYRVCFFSSSDYMNSVGESHQIKIVIKWLRLPHIVQRCERAKKEHLQWYGFQIFSCVCGHKHEHILDGCKCTRMVVFPIGSFFLRIYGNSRDIVWYIDAIFFIIIFFLIQTVPYRVRINPEKKKRNIYCLARTHFTKKFGYGSRMLYGSEREPWCP